MLYLVLFAALIVMYVAYQSRAHQSNRINSSIGLLAGGLVAQLSLNVDLQPFFDSINSYLPTFIGLFGLIGGIVAAMKFAQYIIGIVTRALSGGNV